MTRVRRPRMRPWTLRLDPRTEVNLRVKAAAHGVSRPVYVRALINGDRPGGTPGSMAHKADQWWDSRSPKRRVSIFRNHSALVDISAELEGQLTIEDAGVAE